MDVTPNGRVMETSDPQERKASSMMDVTPEGKSTWPFASGVTAQPARARGSSARSSHAPNARPIEPHAGLPALALVGRPCFIAGAIATARAPHVRHSPPGRTRRSRTAGGGIGPPGHDHSPWGRGAGRTEARPLRRRRGVCALRCGGPPGTPPRWAKRTTRAVARHPRASAVRGRLPRTCRRRRSRCSASAVHHVACPGPRRSRGHSSVHAACRRRWVRWRARHAFF